MSAKVNQLVHDLVSQGRWDEAHSVLMRWHQQQPDDPDALLQCGTLCYTIGRFPDAERFLRDSIQRKDNADAHYYLGLALSKLNRPQDAIAAFRDACDRREGFATAHLQWGLALVQMSSYRGALGQFRQALKLNPRLVAAAYQAGIASYQLGQFSDAVEFFAEACEKDPALAEAFNGLGVSLGSLGQYERALECFSRAWQLNPGLPIVKRNWAAALVNLGRFDEALRHYLDAINLPPKILEAAERALIYNDWGVNLVRQGRTEEAAERLLHAVSIDPGLADARINLGIVNNALQEYEQAAEQFEKAIDLQPKSTIANFQLGLTYFLMAQYEPALQRLQYAKQLDPNNPNLDLWLAYANMATGNLDGAEACVRQAIERNPDNFLAIDALGSCLTMQMRYLEAIDAYKRCLQINNQFGLAHVHLSKTLELAGRDSESMLELKVALQKDPLSLVPEKELIEELVAHASYDLVLTKSKRLLQIVPSDEEVALALARALKAQDRLDEASEVLGALLRNHPQHGPALVLEGQIFLSQGRLLEADERFRAASELGEGDVTLYYGWGKTLGLLGLHELALEKFQKANEIDPYDSDTYEAWGATLKALGRYQDAAEVFKRASEYL